MLRKRLITSFRPFGTGLGKLFGELEAKIMEILWQEGEATARVVFENLRDQGQRLSYSTIKTVMERLANKGILEKKQQARAHVYRPWLSREEFTRSAVNQIMDSLLVSFADPVMSSFVDRLNSDHPERVARLLEMIENAGQSE